MIVGGSKPPQERIQENMLGRDRPIYRPQ